MILAIDPLFHPISGSSSEKKHVCRCLFGRPNVEKTQIWLKTMAEEESKRMAALNEKYNFDFKSEKPLMGSGSAYEWEPLESNTVPSCYTELHRDYEQRKKRQFRPMSNLRSKVQLFGSDADKVCALDSKIFMFWKKLVIFSEY